MTLSPLPPEIPGYCASGRAAARLLRGLSAHVMVVARESLH